MAEITQSLASILACHAAGLESGTVQIEEITTVPLKGGYLSKAVDRLDLKLVTSGQPGITASFVRKACLAAEIRSLEVVSAVSGASALPEVIASWSSMKRPNDPEANGFVSPFYPGGPLTFDDTIPEAVLVTLARIHAECSQTAAFGWAWVFDAAHFAQTLENALSALSSSDRFRATTADHIKWLKRLERVGNSDLLCDASHDLPKTIVHGDMHPGNVVLRADGSPVVIDWGNACIAPPMLDLANIIAIESPQWRTYLSAYSAAGGTIDEVTLRRAYWWARAATGLAYLPWIAGHKSDAPRMILQIEDANERLLEFC